MTHKLDSEVANNFPVTSVTAQINDDDPLGDIRLPWVDDPDSKYFKSHRALTRYSRELKMLTQVMRDYSRLECKPNKNLLDKTLEYCLKAHSIYCAALHQWLENNADSHSACIVQNLVKDYEVTGDVDVKRYHCRASKEPEDRSIATVSTTVSRSSSASGVSVASLKIIQSQQREIEQLKVQTKMKELSLEEKNVELKRKEIELGTYRKMVDNFENATEASDLISNWRVLDEFNPGNSPTGGPGRKKLPGGKHEQNMDFFKDEGLKPKVGVQRNIEHGPQFSLPELSRTAVPSPEIKPVLDTAYVNCQSPMKYNSHNQPRSSGMIDPIVSTLPRYVHGMPIATIGAKSDRTHLNELRPDAQSFRPPDQSRMNKPCEFVQAPAPVYFQSGTGGSTIPGSATTAAVLDTPTQFA